MEVKRLAFVAALGAAFFMSAAFGHAQVMNQQTSPVVPAPTPTSFPIGATPAPGTHSYTIAINNRAIALASCDISGLDGVAVLTPSIAYDNANQHIYGIPWHSQELAATGYNISNNAAYDFVLNGASFFDLDVTTPGSVANATVTCKLLTNAPTFFNYDSQGDVYTNVAGGQINSTVTNPAPTVAQSAGGWLGAALASPPPYSNTITTNDVAAAGAPTGAGSVDTTAPTANSYVSYMCPHTCGAMNLRISGSGWTGSTLYFEKSYDATSPTNGGWAIFTCKQSGYTSAAPTANSTTSNGMFECNAAGAQGVRVRAYGTLSGGTPTVSFSSSEINNPTVLQTFAFAGSNGPVVPEYCDNPPNTAANGGSANPLLAQGTIASTTAAALITGVSGSHATVCGLFLENPNASAVTLNIASGANACTTLGTAAQFTVNGGQGAVIQFPNSYILKSQQGQGVCIWLSAAAASGLQVSAPFNLHP